MSERSSTVKAWRLVALMVVFMLLTAGLVALEWTSAARGVWLSAEKWVTALSDLGAYPRLRDQIAAAIDLSELPAREEPKARRALAQALAPDWIAAQAELVLREGLGFVAGRVPAVTAAIPLREVTDAFLQAYSETGHFLVLMELRRRLGELPDSIAVAPYLEEAGLVEAARYGRWLDRAPGVLVGACAFLALAAYGMAAGWRTGLRWVGAAGLVSGLLGLGSGPVIGRFAAELVAGLELAGTGSGFSALARELAGWLVGSTWATVRTWALATAGCGLGLLMAAGVRRR